MTNSLDDQVSLKTKIGKGIVDGIGNVFHNLFMDLPKYLANKFYFDRCYEIPHKSFSIAFQDNKFIKSTGIEEGNVKNILRTEMSNGFNIDNFKKLKKEHPEYFMPKADIFGSTKKTLRKIGTESFIVDTSYQFINPPPREFTSKNGVTLEVDPRTPFFINNPLNFALEYGGRGITPEQAYEHSKELLIDIVYTVFGKHIRSNDYPELLNMTASDRFLDFEKKELIERLGVKIIYTSEGFKEVKENSNNLVKARV